MSGENITAAKFKCEECNLPLWFPNDASLEYTGTEGVSLSKHCKAQVHNVFQYTVLLHLICFYFLPLFSTLGSNRRRALELYLNTDGMMAQHLLQLVSSYVTEFIFNIS